MDYFKRIISVVEHYERLYGRVNPVVLAEKSPLCPESIKLLVYSDFALGISKYPNSLEDVMRVLMFHAVKHGRMMTGESKQVEMMTLVCRFRQQWIQQKSWSCGKVGQVRKDCPEPKKEPDALDSDSKSKMRVSFAGWAG